jgi:hypothetical protein
MFWRFKTSVFGGGAVACAIMIASSIAHAGVSVDDGYGPDGLPQQHFELDPYVWLPATSAKIFLGNGAAVNISQGVPSPSDLVSKLNGAFLGFGLARYGAFSAELDVNYVSATETKNLGGNILTLSRSLNPASGMKCSGVMSARFPRPSMRGSVSPLPTPAPRSASHEPTSLA